MEDITRADALKQGATIDTTRQAREWGVEVPIAISEDTAKILRISKGSRSREEDLDDFLRQLVTSSRAKFLLDEPVPFSVFICGDEHEFVAVAEDGDPGEGRWSQ
jgi:hypothetical protein